MRVYAGALAFGVTLRLCCKSMASPFAGDASIDGQISTATCSVSGKAGEVYSEL